MAEVSRFLIVDDSEANILFFQVALQQLGKTDVFTATDGNEALTIFDRERIQFLITAWELREISGTVLVQKLRSDRRKMYTPCLIYSKRMSEDDIKLTKELGLDNVLGMPFDKASATEMISKMIEAEENLSSLEIKVRKIEGFISENMPAEALKLVDPSVTKKSPLRPRVKTALGEIWIMVGQHKKAEVILNEALKDHPDYLPAKYMLARLFSLIDRHQDAISLLEEASNQSPHNIKTLLSLGSAYVDANDHNKAREIFQKVEDIDDNNQNLKDEQGKLAFKEGDIPLAAQLLAETQNGDFLARQFNNMAIAQTVAGNYPKAIETYSNALRILSDKAKVHLLTFNMGLAYRKSGDLENGFLNLCKSYLLEPSFEKAYNSLAKVAKEIKEKGGKPDHQLVQKVKATRKKYTDSHKESKVENVS
ncbi:MAG: tetratricopeptide repeat protein [Bdellovibrionota bacterium]